MSADVWVLLNTSNIVVLFAADVCEDTICTQSGATRTRFVPSPVPRGHDLYSVRCHEDTIFANK